MAEFEPYNEQWEREMMRLPKPMLIKLYKEACLRNNDNVPVDKPVSEKIAKMAILMLHNWMHAQIRIFGKQKQAKEQESNRENWNAGYVACCDDIIANLKGFLKDNFNEDNITEEETIIKNFVSNFSR